MNTIIVNGQTYVKAESKSDCVVVRTYSAGVHVGKIKERNGKEVTLVHSRRIWCWEGAASLSQFAINGVSKPEKCKFSVIIPEIILTEAIEIIPMTEEAVQCVYGVPEWKA